MASLISPPPSISYLFRHKSSLYGTAFPQRYPLNVEEPRKYFDQVIVTVRSGDGGHGVVLAMPNQRPPSKPPQGKHEKEKLRRKSLLKRNFGVAVVLPVGGHGGDVVIYADEGTVVKHKRGTLLAVKRKRGTLLADLAWPGDEILVARGGQGGISLVETPDRSKKKVMARTTNVMRDGSDKVLAVGQPGEEIRLVFIVRVVADVGLVIPNIYLPLLQGLPNAGNLTLLAATTLARPDITDYPFTTLMPNVGCLDGDPSLGSGMYSSEATFADLPGLIEGAHLGKGLGRNFLRHLRRTRLLVHVVDAAAENPVNDYRTVKEELRMYNPDYLERPYIVVFNKIDLPQAKGRLPSLTEEIMRLGIDNASYGSETSIIDAVQQPSSEGRNADVSSSRFLSKDRKEKVIEDYPRPLAIVGVSVLKGIRVNEMLKAIRAGLRKCRGINEALQLSETG
ncbi:probable GTP-binding protein OBGC2 [Malus sylvestris]|uniref:probable GTP-binding protein OBGC2 n=1 Tax=Malus sylvestris TaxID=3752 RepID=UPI0021AD24B8|nr:probable GTP-binding protein OBGC2 [Malus sylvestris]